MIRNAKPGLTVMVGAMVSCRSTICPPVRPIESCDALRMARRQGEAGRTQPPIRRITRNGTCMFRQNKDKKSLNVHNRLVPGRINRLRQSAFPARRLSIETRAIKRGPVPTPTTSPLDRLIVALCVALMIFYAAMTPAKAANQIQHAPALMISHDHSGPGIFSINAIHDNQEDHADHHEDAPDTGDQPGDPLAGGHHHHGDSGPNLLMPLAAATSSTSPRMRLHGIGQDRQIAGLRSIEPERPPRICSLNV